MPLSDEQVEQLVGDSMKDGIILASKNLASYVESLLFDAETMTILDRNTVSYIAKKIREREKHLSENIIPSMPTVAEIYRERNGEGMTP